MTPAERIAQLEEELTEARERIARIEAHDARWASRHDDAQSALAFERAAHARTQAELTDARHVHQRELADGLAACNEEIGRYRVAHERTQAELTEARRDRDAHKKMKDANGVVLAATLLAYDHITDERDAERVTLLESVATKARHISEDAFYTDDGQQMLIDPGFIRELRGKLDALDEK